MGRAVLLLLFVAAAISRDIFEPTDLDKIFNSEGKEGASEKKDDKQKSGGAAKDKQHIGFQYSNESTTACFINPQTSDKKAQKAQLSYVVSLSSLLSSVSAAPTSTSTRSRTSSASAPSKSSSVLSSTKSAPALAEASSAKSTTPASSRKSKGPPEETRSSSHTSSVLTSISSKDDSKDVSEYAAAAARHREEAPASSKKKKHEDAEPVKGQYWTTVMAYGSPEKVLIGVKTITIIESIIREPAVSGAASSIAKSVIGEKADAHRGGETIKVGDVVLAPRGASDTGQHGASAGSAASSRPELAADMPALAKKDKSATASGEEKVSKTTSTSTKHHTVSSADSALEKLATVPPVHKSTEHEDTAGLSKSAVYTSHSTKASQHKTHRESTSIDAKSVHTTDKGKGEKASSQTAHKSHESHASSVPTPSAAKGVLPETAPPEKDSGTATASKHSISSVTMKRAEPKLVSTTILSSAISKVDISSIRHKLSQVNEKIQMSLSSAKSRQTSAATSFATVASAKAEEKEPEGAAVQKSTSTSRPPEPASGHALSRKPAKSESHTPKSSSARKKSSQQPPSTVSSTTVKKHKEGFGGLGIWKRIGDFSNDGEESSRDTSERSGHVSSTAVKSAGAAKESSGDRSRKSASIVDILTALNDVSKKKEDNAQVFVDGAFQAKQNDKRLGDKFKFKGWISSSANE